MPRARAPLQVHSGDREEPRPRCAEREHGPIHRSRRPGRSEAATHRRRNRGDIRVLSQLMARVRGSGAVRGAQDTPIARKPNRDGFFRDVRGGRSGNGQNALYACIPDKPYGSCVCNLYEKRDVRIVFSTTDTSDTSDRRQRSLEGRGFAGVRGKNQNVRGVRGWEFPGPPPRSDVKGSAACRSPTPDNLSLQQRRVHRPRGAPALTRPAHPTCPQPLEQRPRASIVAPLVAGCPAARRKPCPLNLLQPDATRAGHPPRAFPTP